MSNNSIVYRKLDGSSLRAQLRHPVLMDGRHVIAQAPEGFVIMAVGEAK